MTFIMFFFIQNILMDMRFPAFYIGKRIEGCK
jgi:hypothetical protein